MMVGVILFSIGILLWLIDFFSKNTKLSLKPTNQTPRIAILIPARDESLVIEGLLKSLKEQTYPVSMEDVYIIVEQKEDKTCDIAKTYRANIVIRKNLFQKTKGYALDEGMHYIKKQNKHYDLYFIFDADNILDKHYIEEMVHSYQKGYDIVTGYRNCKNGKDGVIASASMLTFSLINTFMNKRRIQQHKNIILSGTGFFIRGELLEQFSGYPFCSLTEDYELTVYATIHGWTTYYNKNAIFYDEQPTHYEQVKSQRLRWIKGYLSVHKQYGKELLHSLRNSKNKASIISECIGILPYLFWILAFLWIWIFYLLKQKTIVLKVTVIIIGCGILYMILWILTLYLLYIERKQLKISSDLIILTLFYHPLFLLGYIPSFIKALSTKEVSWNKIEHNVQELEKMK